MNGENSDVLTIAVLDRLAKNTGCNVHNDCLTCPLPECKYVTGHSEYKKVRYDVIRRMAEEMTDYAVAEQLGISVRTVRRALEEI